MVLFLSVLDWNGLESLDQFTDPVRCVIFKKQHKQGDSIGERQPPLQCLSQSFLQEKEKDQLPWALVHYIPLCGRMDRHL